MCIVIFSTVSGAGICKRKIAYNCEQKGFLKLFSTTYSLCDHKNMKGRHILAACVDVRDIAI